MVVFWLSGWRIHMSANVFLILRKFYIQKLEFKIQFKFQKIEQRTLLQIQNFKSAEPKL